MVIRPRISSFIDNNLKKIIILFFLSILVISTIVIGILYRHYFVVSVFGVWLVIETLLQQLKKIQKEKRSFLIKHLRKLKYVISSLNISDPHNESKIATNILKLSEQIPNIKWIKDLKHITELRELALGMPKKGEKNLIRFLTHKNLDKLNISLPDSLILSDISEAASSLATLYWYLYEVAVDSTHELSKIARHLFSIIFEENFDDAKSKMLIAKITDLLQRNGGITYLILNLLKYKRVNDAKKISLQLLTKELSVSEEHRSSLYWLTEIYWFLNTPSLAITDFQTTIRYLYHLCFTNPERAGFLEIDSQFFPEFITVNEIAREGFLFKETLIDELIILWKEHENVFNQIFSSTLKVLTGENNKAYDSPDMYEKFWNRERENFGKEFLLIVEGNLCYATNHFEDAAYLYEKSRSLSPLIRASNFNLLFCYAKLGNIDEHETLIRYLIKHFGNHPSLYSIIGNSYLLMNNEKKSDEFYEKLPNSWKLKENYYKSTFCYNQKLFDKALYYAKKAFEINPNDSAINYHLSLCFSAVGEKKSALDVLNIACHRMVLANEDQWLKYYRFTLERDAGLHQQAISTLLKIPPDYFDDPEELESLIKYAKDQKNLNLVRQLIENKKKN